MELPDPKAIFPYLGLFTLVTLNPTQVTGASIPTLFLPPLSIIRGKKFVKAPSNTFPTAKNVARIFEPLALVDNSPFTHGAIPISPDGQAFEEKRYWRIPVPPASIFAALIARLHHDTSGSEDIRLAKAILGMQSLDEYEDDGNGGPSDGGGGPSGGGGPNDDNEGGGEPSGGGRAPSKRKAAGGRGGARHGNGTKKPRLLTLEFPPPAQYQNQASDHCEIASSTYIPDDDDLPAHLINTGWDDDSDSENGRSEGFCNHHFTNNSCD